MGALCGLHYLGRSAGTPEVIDSAGTFETSPSLAAITKYADAVGLMFQIMDDLLDVTQTTDHLGKKAGKDLDAGKLTYPGVHGIEESRRQVRKLETTALDSLTSFGLDAEPLRQLASYMAVRTR
jgi:geranylgeranyl diphosphate synthase, type II